MRHRRWLAPEGVSAPVYHCFSRVVDRQFIFSDAEKDIFRSLLMELADFCQVRILTYCIMSNHFHALVEVPRPPEPLPTAEQTLEALGKLSGCQDVDGQWQQLRRFREANDSAAESEWLARIHARRWNLSQFFKCLKQRYSVSYNRRSGRKGTLWEERFNSVLVEGEGHALIAMATYIDLNPVRARIVRDPKDYRWSGYGESVAGHERAREGLRRIVQAIHRTEIVDPGEILDAYRRQLFLDGSEERESIGEDGRPTRGAIAREDVLRVLSEKGRLPLREYLRCRVRYFCDGAVIGGRQFVEEMFRASRERFGPRRRTGARKMRGLEGLELYTVRDLQVDLFL